MWARVMACGVVLAGCGRSGFDPVARDDGDLAPGVDAPNTTDATDASTATDAAIGPPAIKWVKNFGAKLDIAGGTSQTFTTSASRPNSFNFTVATLAPM